MPQRQTQMFGGGWTEKKLTMLKKYLAAYTTALKNQPFELVYIDAFAGTGYRAPDSAPNGQGLFSALSEQEPQKFLEGSARIALQTEPPFHRYVFVEKSPTRFAELAALKDEFPDMADCIDLQNKECNRYLQEICQSWDRRGRRAVLFLDPFGMQVDWKTIEAIAATRAIDTWILFPLGIAVNRLLKRDGDIPDKWREQLDVIFGTSEWHRRFYSKDASPSLFGQKAGRQRKIAGFEAISKYYNERLKLVFQEVAPNPRPLYNSKGNPLFLFCFAAGNPKGAPIAVKIAQHILKG